MKTLIGNIITLPKNLQNGLLYFSPKKKRFQNENENKQRLRFKLLSVSVYNFLGHKSSRYFRETTVLRSLHDHAKISVVIVTPFVLRLV